jgi:hypothetical protein
VSRERVGLTWKHQKKVTPDVRKPISKGYGTRGRSPECIRGHESETRDTMLSGLDGKAKFAEWTAFFPPPRLKRTSCSLVSFEICVTPSPTVPSVFKTPW